MDMIINGALFALGFTAVQTVLFAAWLWFFLRHMAKDAPPVFEYIDTDAVKGMFDGRR